MSHSLVSCGCKEQSRIDAFLHMAPIKADSAFVRIAPFFVAQA